MRSCWFEDRGVEGLEPLTLTRPAFALRCGAATLFERLRRYVGANDIGVLVRPWLAELCRQTDPQLAVNDLAWLRAADTVMLNARWLPPAEPTTDWTTPRVALVGDQVAYAVVPAAELRQCSPKTLEDGLETWKEKLPQVQAGSLMLNYPWELLQPNGELLARDFEQRRRERGRSYRPANLTVVGPSDRLFVHASARIDPQVVADTTHGPVMIEHDAVVQPFSFLEGPCYVGPYSQVLGAKIRAGTHIGPRCRVAGEVAASILQGHVDKPHDGYLGHSYVGEGVRFDAGVQVSDQRREEASIWVTMHGRRIDTGLDRLGAIVGDHTLLSAGTLLDRGSVLGAFCEVMPSGALASLLLPSFTAYRYGQLFELSDINALPGRAEASLRQLGGRYTSAHTGLWRRVYDQTSVSRRQFLREQEHYRLRRSA